MVQWCFKKIVFPAPLVQQLFDINLHDTVSFLSLIAQAFFFQQEENDHVQDEITLTAPLQDAPPWCQSRAETHAQLRADGRDRASKSMGTSISAPFPRNTVPTAEKDTPRHRHHTSGPGAGQGRGLHTPAIGSQRPEVGFDQGVSADFWELSLRK